MAESELSSLVGRTSTSEHGKQTQSAGPARLAIGLRLASWSSIQNASSSRLLHDSRDNYLDFHRKAKSVVLTETGLNLAEKLLRKHFGRES